MKPAVPSIDKTPLPGAVMPMDEVNKLERKTITPANDRAAPHYSDKGDHDQTIPI